jgi:7,8-dihydropterin-6-yl-methyl-4-(beta-D-ribofuranosyl)aminobenzene 5'-phosphate synthase
MNLSILGFSLALVAAIGPAATDAAAVVAAARVVILSDNVVGDDGVGEWGFAALVEADGHRILFDTGAHPDAVLRNAKTLGVDLDGITDVVLSHWHDDHTGGLVSLRQELARRNASAVSRAHVGRGFFWNRREGGKPLSSQADLRAAYEAAGGRFVEHADAGELYPGVWLTGHVPRRTRERNVPSGIQVRRPDGAWADDDVPDDLSLAVETAEGLVIVTGCGHAGIVNTIEAARERIRPAPVAAIVGGLHLYEATDAHVDWTASQLKRLRVAHLIGSHCTGLEALSRLRRGAGLSRRTAVVGSVGASYASGAGIDPRLLAR